MSDADGGSFSFLLTVSGEDEESKRGCGGEIFVEDLLRFCDFFDATSRSLKREGILFAPPDRMEICTVGEVARSLSNCFGVDACFS